MMDFKVEYVEPGFLLNESDKAQYQPVRQKGMIPVVRLAEVKKLIAELEWAMERVINNAPSCNKQRAQACLASVAAWRKGQEGA